MLKVAAVQMASANGDIPGNLRRAVPLVEEAAEAGAQLICLPEFLPSGYIFDESNWLVGEPADGPTTAWIVEHAKRLGVYLGTSFLETDGEDFFNAFVLAGPEGVLGKTYKQAIAYYENFTTAPKVAPHVIATPIGRIGVGICHENTQAYLSRTLVEEDADILLQPHSAPSLPDRTPAYGRRLMEKATQEAPVKYARGLGIPTVFCNKCGRFDSPRPMFPWGRFVAPFQGGSAIVDSDGTVKARLQRQEAVIVTEVELSQERKTKKPLPARGNWVLDSPRLALAYIDFVVRRGQASYRDNPRRAEAARRQLGLSTSDGEASHSVAGAHST